MIFLSKNLRPFTPQDYQAYAELLNISNPDHPQTSQDIKQFDQGYAEGEIFERRLWVHEGELLGAIEVGTPRYNPIPGHLEVELCLHPKVLQEENKQHLYKAIVDIAQLHKPKTLTTSTVEGRWEMPFFQSQGFKEVDRMWASVLDVTTFDPTPFEHFKLKSAKAGITIKPLSELSWQTESFQRQWYELIIDLLAAIPSANPNQPWPFELWQRRMVYVPTLAPESSFFALYQDELVGISELKRSNRPQTLQTGLTGVRASWRRKGIAQTLKLAAAEYARAKGYQFIRTNNHSINQPMLAINEAMGFVRQSIRVNLEKDMRC